MTKKKSMYVRQGVSVYMCGPLSLFLSVSCPSQSSCPPALGSDYCRQAAGMAGMRSDVNADIP